MRATSNLSLNNARDSDSTILLGSPFQYLTTSSMKKFLLVSKLKHSTSALHFFPRPCPQGSQLGPVPGWPVIRGVVLAIIQGAVLIQGAGDDQAEFVPCKRPEEQ